MLNSREAQEGSPLETILQQNVLGQSLYLSLLTTTTTTILISTITLTTIVKKRSMFPKITAALQLQIYPGDPT